MGRENAVISADFPAVPLRSQKIDSSQAEEDGNRSDCPNLYSQQYLVESSEADNAESSAQPSNSNRVRRFFELLQSMGFTAVQMHSIARAVRESEIVQNATLPSSDTDLM